MIKNIDEKKLLELKKEIESVKMKMSEYRGQKQMLLKELQTKFDCKNLDEAQNKLNELIQSKQNIEKKIDRAIEQLHNNYDIEI